jgi:hypothetical protein
MISPAKKDGCPIPMTGIMCEHDATDGQTVTVDDNFVTLKGDMCTRRFGRGIIHSPVVPIHGKRYVVKNATDQETGGNQKQVIKDDLKKIVDTTKNEDDTLCAKRPQSCVSGPIAGNPPVLKKQRNDINATSVSLFTKEGESVQEKGEPQSEIPIQAAKEQQHQKQEMENSEVEMRDETTDKMVSSPIDTTIVVQKTQGEINNTLSNAVQPISMTLGDVSNVQMNQEEHYHQERRLRPVYAESGIIVINPDEQNFVLNGLNGMEDVSQLLYKCIVKPVAAAETYRKTCGKLGSLHFAIVGEDGTGKRQAVTTVCTSASVTVFYIEANRFQQKDLSSAIMRACESRPSVICFDGFDALMEKKDFEAEFMVQVRGCAELLSTWDMVWLAFCVKSKATVDTYLRDIVMDRVAYVKPLTGFQAAELLRNVFLPLKDLPLLEPLSRLQLDTLQSAAAGCTPKQLKQFAFVVTLSALNRCEIGTLAAISGNRVVGGGIQDGSGGQQQHPPSGTTAPQQLFISWKDDAESQYETYRDTNDCAKRKIRRYDQPTSMEDFGPTQDDDVMS